MIDDHTYRIILIFGIASGLDLGGLVYRLMHECAKQDLLRTGSEVSMIAEEEN